MSVDSPPKAPFPFDNGNFIKDLFFTWIFPLTQFYRKTPPTDSNLYDLPTRLNYKSYLKQTKYEWNKVKSSSNPNIFYALWPVIKKEFFTAMMPGTIGYNCHLITSLMVYYIVEYINGQIDSIAPYIVVYGVSLLYGAMSLNYSYKSILILTAKIKAVLSQMIFEKTLKTYYGEISQGVESGKIISLVSADLEFLEGSTILPFFFAMPLIITGGAVILWFNIGVAGLVGVFVAALHMPLVLYFGKLLGRIRFLTAAIGDSRMKFITNLIEGIRIVKLYAWETPYLEVLFSKRKQEINQYKRKIAVSSTNKAINYGSVGLVLFTTFSVYIALGNKLQASTTFCSISVLIIVTSKISMTGASGIMQIFLIINSMRRISEALLIKEKTKERFGKDEGKQEYSIIAKKCKFVWKEPKKANGDEALELTKNSIDSGFSLSGVNFKVKKGELVVVIGSVGSGKSALLLGLMQEIHLKQGEVNINGSLSFVSEEPWIVSGTIKENILMDNPEDTEFYYDVIDKCCLHKDLELFKNHGDETVVGDRGITLSGGQKARVSLARAVYTNRDIVLLDDPLSAVDPEVCFGLFNNCIKGILKEKTVILVTHQAHFVSQADKILILDAGRQIFFGTYQELIDKNLINYLGKIEQTEEKAKNSNEIEEKPKRQATIKDSKSILAEESAKGSVPFQIYWKFFLLGYKNIFFIFFSALLQIAGQVAYLAVIYWLVHWSNASDQSNPEYIYGMAIIVGVLYLLTYLRVISIEFPILNSAQQLHNHAIKGLAHTSSLFFDKNPTGRILNRFSKDTSQIDEVLIMFITETSFNATLVLGNFISIAIISPYILIALAGIIIYFIFVVKYFSSVSKGLKRLEQVTKSPVLSLLNSSVHGLTTIRCLGLKKKLKNDMKASIEVNFKAYLGFHILFRAIQLYLEFGPIVVGLANVIVLVNIKDSMNPSLAGMSLSLTLTILGYVGFLFKTAMETDNYMTSTQRLFEYKEILSEVQHTSNSAFKITQGKIEIRDLYMRYRENYDCALKNLSFTIQAGMKTGIVGRTGAGKSSIMQVLFRLTNPEQGTIFIDGQDYLQAGLHELRKQMSVIPQSATLFIANLRDNLDPFHEHDDQEIVKILKKVRLGPLLDLLPKGLDEEINSQGVSLSAGQKQLVCLARAVLRKNKIVMIDEATANVDSETDEFIQKQLNKRFKGCSLLIIAHRLRTVVDSDWIVVMEEGSRVEEGRPEELIERDDSRFLAMIKHTGPEESRFLLSKLQSLALFIN